MEGKAAAVKERPDPRYNTPTHHAVRVTLREGRRTLQWVRVEEHRWSAWETAREPDCTREGIERRFCLVCGGVQNRRLAPYGHVVHQTAESDKYTGEPVVQCIVCGMVFRNGRAFPPEKEETAE